MIALQYRVSQKKSLRFKPFRDCEVWYEKMIIIGYELLSYVPDLTYSRAGRQTFLPPTMPCGMLTAGGLAPYVQIQRRLFIK